MPISDLLASITGERPRPSASAADTTRASAPPLKRKAADELTGSAQKTQRTVPVAGGPPGPNVSTVKPVHPPQKPAYAGTATNAKAASTPRPLPDKPTGPPVVKRSSAPPSNVTQVGSPPSASPLRRPFTTSASKPRMSAGGGPPKAPPKKGSYAEIMARASRAQATMGPVGKIQHKAIEKLPSRRERDESRTELARPAKKGAKQAPSSPNGRHGSNGTSHARVADQAVHRLPTSVNSVDPKQSRGVGKGAKPGPDGGKKMKKAASATTGYTGTARPVAPKSGTAQPTAPGGSRDRDGARKPYGAFTARRSRYDDYDSELDDFIEDDEEEPEEPGYGYRYAGSEDGSDMEAGLSEIDVEERRAEFVARKEDAAEEALEKKLKREKEDRKRRLLEARAGR